MSQSNRLTYRVDIVLCIDVTGSMEPIISMVRKNALALYSDLTRCMQEKGKVIHQLRVRVIAFRDYLADGEDAMGASEFFVLPEDGDKFKECVDSLVATGGGDIPEDGLEALGYAIRSPWDTEGMKHRHMIVVWTDAPTHDLGFGSTAPNYPKGMAADFGELSRWWMGPQDGGYMDQSAKRLLLFAPNDAAWSSISAAWDNVIHVQSIAGEGLREHDYAAVLDAISNTI